MKKTTKKKKSKKTKDEMYLELNGTVNIVSVFDGKKSSSPLKSDVVLTILRRFLEDAIKEKFFVKDKRNGQRVHKRNRGLI